MTEAAPVSQSVAVGEANAFIGVYLSPRFPTDVTLHITLCFINNSTHEQRMRAWTTYVAALNERLPFVVSIGERIAVGRNNDVPANEAHVDRALLELLKRLYRENSVREGNEFPELMLHITVDTEERRAALAGIGRFTLVNTLYLSTTGPEKQVLAELTRN